jgi:hypothetical protein
VGRATSAASSSRGKAGSQRVSKPVSKRGIVVLASLAGALTLVGGSLWLTGNTARVPSNVAPMLATSSTTLTTAGGESGLNGQASARQSPMEAVLNLPQPVASGRWKAIVIHDSGELVGSPRTLDERATSMGLKGLGYHFVVGNGSGMSDGQVFVAQRWMGQSSGAHTAGEQGEWFNQHAIGICMVGDGNRERFTTSQTSATIELVRTLCGKLGIPADRVYLHSQLAPTTSPGKFFPEAQLRAALMR